MIGSSHLITTNHPPPTRPKRATPSFRCPSGLFISLPTESFFYEYVQLLFRLCRQVKYGITGGIIHHSLQYGLLRAKAWERKSDFLARVNCCLNNWPEKVWGSAVKKTGKETGFAVRFLHSAYARKVARPIWNKKDRKEHGEG